MRQNLEETPQDMNLLPHPAKFWEVVMTARASRYATDIAYLFQD
jgi:hypothetical protein